MQKIITLLLIVIMLVTLYNSRWIFNFRYEPNYFEQYYYHSQWYIPESTRTISDSDLYKYVGYRLVGGENTFNINYEVPPFGKYLYGLAEKYFGNPYLISISFYLISIVLVFLLSKEIFLDKTKQILATLLFSLNPLLTAQITQTMLDLPQTVFFMAHGLFFLKGIKQKSWEFIILAGLFLGLMTGTKIGLYTPFIVFLDLGFILFTNYRYALGFIPSIGAGYVLAFFSYFIKHPNPIPWLRLHKMVLKFYFDSGVSSNPLNELVTIFFNRYSGWWDTSKNIISSEWSIVWPVGVAAVLIIIFKYRKHIKSELAIYYLSLSGLIILFLNSLVPFWPRYLVILLPVFSIAIVKTFYKKPWWLFLIVVVSAAFFIKGQIPDPVVTANIFATARSTSAYHELYRLLDTQSQRVSEIDFENQMRLIDAHFKDIDTSVLHVGKNSFGLLTMYDTYFGPINHVSEIKIVKEWGQWKINWDWNYVWQDFKYGDNLKAINVNTKDEDLFIQVIPEKFGNWNTTLRAIDEIDGKTINENWQLIKRFVPDKYPIDVAFVAPDYKKSDLDYALSLPGVMIVNRPRTYLSGELVKYR